MMANTGLLNGWSSDHLPISVKIENIHLKKIKPQSNDVAMEMEMRKAG